jgi:hypothetical protein
MGQRKPKAQPAAITQPVVQYDPKHRRQRQPVEANAETWNFLRRMCVAVPDDKPR